MTGPGGRPPDAGSFGRWPRLGSLTTRARLVVIAFLAVFVAFGVALDRRAARPEPPPPLAAARTPIAPTATPPSSLSSIWYCPGGQANPDGQAETSVVLANPTDRSASGQLTVQPVSGAPKEVAVSVAARGQTIVRLSEAFGASVVAGATVELDQGGVVAQETIKVPEGTIVGPCASAASPTWYAPAGSTGRDANTFLSILNPFPDDAIVDLRFATDEGGAAPADLQGVVVPSRHLTVVEVGAHVRRREVVASQVTARRGRVVVGKLQRRGASITATLAAPGPNPIWHFPSGGRIPGLADRIELFNPGDQDASVTVQLSLAEAAVEPQTVTVPAQDRAQVQVNANPAIPEGATYAVTVRTADGPGVVAERTFNATRPISSGTYADELGLVAGASSWVSATGTRSGNGMSIVNVGLEEARVGLVVLDGAGGPVRGLESMVIPSGGRIGVGLDGRLANASQSVQVNADQPILVDRGGFDASGPSSYVPAVALG